MITIRTVHYSVNNYSVTSPVNDEWWIDKLTLEIKHAYRSKVNLNEQKQFMSQDF